MRVLLVQPEKPDAAVGGEDLSIFEPLALEYLAAGLGEGHEARILDMRFDKDLEAVLQGFSPHIVGITAYTVHVNTARRLFGLVKQHSGVICTVAGGHHATVMPEDFCDPAVDIVVTGEGVDAFARIVGHIEAGGSPGTIDGAQAMGCGAGTVLVRGDEQPDLDALPFPRRDLTAQYRQRYFSEWMRPLASIRTSKGCHYRCSFCALWKLTGGRYLTRKPERIIEELRTIDEECVFFADDESMLDAERMHALADMIKESGIRKRYFLYGRSDTIVRHPELIENWKGVGLERVFVGLEFFRDSDLRYIKKGSTVENNVKAVQILKDHGIDIFPSFIVRQDFGKEDFREFRRFCLGLDLDFVAITVLTPLPGTDFFQEVRDRMICTNYDYFDFIHTLLPTRLPIKKFYRELITLYNRSRTVRGQMRLLRKYPLRELPGLVRLYIDLMNRLRRMHTEYPP